MCARHCWISINLRVHVLLCVILFNIIYIEIQINMKYFFSQNIHHLDFQVTHSKTWTLKLMEIQQCLAHNYHSLNVYLIFFLFMFFNPYQWRTLFKSLYFLPLCSLLLWKLLLFKNKTLFKIPQGRNNLRQAQSQGGHQVRNWGSTEVRLRTSPPLFWEKSSASVDVLLPLSSLD